MITYELDFNKGAVVVGHYQYPKCPSCDSAKELLKENDIQYTFIQADKKLFGKVMAVTKQITVPQIFIDGEFVGGFEDLEAKIKGENQ
jgi:glutaredoxin